MKPSVLCFPVIALTALAFAGCGGDSNAESLGGDPHGISVTGTGSVEAEPDTAFVTLGVEVTATTVEEARREAADVAARVIDALTDAGVEERDLRTTNYSIYPRYEFTRDEQTLVGYVVSNTLRVTIRDLDSAGELIDLAVAEAGDAARVSSIGFEIEDNTVLLERARELAMQDARAKAEQLAELADVELGQPLSIVESQSTTPPPEYRDAAADGGQTPILPGAQAVTVTVSVIYAID